MVITIADEAACDPRTIHLLELRAQAELTAVLLFFCHGPSCSPMALCLVSAGLEPTASHPDLLSPGARHCLSKCMLLRDLRGREEHSGVSRGLKTWSGLQVLLSADKQLLQMLSLLQAMESSCACSGATLPVVLTGDGNHADFLATGLHSVPVCEESVSSEKQSRMVGGNELLLSEEQLGEEGAWSNMRE